MLRLVLLVDDESCAREVITTLVAFALENKVDFPGTSAMIRRVAESAIIEQTTPK